MSLLFADVSCHVVVLPCSKPELEKSFVAEATAAQLLFLNQSIACQLSCCVVVLPCSKPELEKSFVAEATAAQLLFLESFDSM
jgi:phosphoserine aminotransferase